MRIIPVIDLYNGSVVHAKKGQRSHYLPINSRLCTSSNPIEIINCFLKLYDFKCIYIADLNALQNQGNNTKAIMQICDYFPSLEIWLDTGIDLVEHYLNIPKPTLLRIILSTESLDSIDIYHSIINNHPDHKFIFSIDYIHGDILGANELLQENIQLTTDVLFINLDQVGTNGGVDIPKQINFQSLTKLHNVYYGGGIKCYENLNELKKLGFSGALISSALHDNSISNDNLLSIRQ